MPAIIYYSEYCISDQYVLQIQKSPNSAEVEQNNPSITDPLLDNNNNNNNSDVKFV